MFVLTVCLFTFLLPFGSLTVVPQLYHICENSKNNCLINKTLTLAHVVIISFFTVNVLLTSFNWPELNLFSLMVAALLNTCQNS